MNYIQFLPGLVYKGCTVTGMKKSTFVGLYCFGYLPNCHDNTPNKPFTIGIGLGNHICDIDAKFS